MERTKSEEKIISINGKKVFYWEKIRGQKETVVLLHGYPGSYGHLMDLATNLGEKYRLVMPNFPSCGGSEPLEEEHNLKNYAEWLNAFLQKASVDRAIIIGHSFGSRVALAFSAAYPEKVARLVLITPVLKPDSLLVYLVLLKYEIAKLLPPNACKAFLSSKLYEYAACKIVLKSKNSEQQKKIIDRGIKELQHVDPLTQIDLFEDFYKSDLSPLGKKIKAKSLIVAGEKDEVATLKSIKGLFSHMEDASLKVIKNAGHLLPFEIPGETAKIIKLWLKT
jgi:pimeloyl-ACP methyl ester carboxylesterase